MPSHSSAIQSLSYWAVAAISDGHKYQMVYQNDEGGNMCSSGRYCSAGVLLLQRGLAFFKVVEFNPVGVKGKFCPYLYEWAG